jgi:hypothetical protein
VHHSTSIATKLSFPQLSVRQPFVAAHILGFIPWPFQWKTWWDQRSESGSHASPTITREPHSSPSALEPVLAHPDHPFTFWTSWSQSLLVLDCIKIGHTAINPLSSLRSETLSTLVLDWSECYSFTHFYCPLTPDPAEITREHFANSIEPSTLLAHQATSLSTFLRAEIGHEFCRN